MKLVLLCERLKEFNINRIYTDGWGDLCQISESKYLTSLFYPKRNSQLRIKKREHQDFHHRKIRLFTQTKPLLEPVYLTKRGDTAVLTDEVLQEDVVDFS